jgi:hypothetical protein
MKYDPTKPDPSSKELEQLSEDEFFEWLDTKAEYLKTKTRKLNSHEIKKIAYLDAIQKGKDISDTEWETIKKIGKENEQENNKRWQK